MDPGVQVYGGPLFKVLTALLFKVLSGGPLFKVLTAPLFKVLSGAPPSLRYLALCSWTLAHNRRPSLRRPPL